MTRTNRGLVLAGMVLVAVVGLGLRAVERPAAGVDARIATVDLFSVAEKIILSKPYTEARSAEEKVWQDRLQPLGEQIKDLRVKLDVVGQNTPDAKQVLADAQSAMNQYQQIQQQAGVALDQFRGNQLREAYEKSLDIANAIAEERGYTHVIVTRDRKAESMPVGLNATIQLMLAQPVIMAPAEDDLTEAVVEKLDLADEG